MNKIKSALVIATLLLGMLPLMAQEKRVSPHETLSANIGGNRVTIVYGRPYTKNPKTGEVRKIWGGLVPYGQVWRMGADESTLLITEKPLTLGGASVPAGAYSLYMLPNEDGSAKLIINKRLGQWGTQYDDSQDLARVDMTKDALDTPVDQCTIAISKGASGGGVIKLSWESTQYSVAYTVTK
jgi:hypothetical protein